MFLRSGIKIKVNREIFWSVFASLLVRLRGGEKKGDLKVGLKTFKDKRGD